MDLSERRDERCWLKCEERLLLVPSSLSAMIAGACHSR
jgi:hypothetical protein